MTGLTDDDIARIITGLMVTRPWHPNADMEQMERIRAALRDESDTRMLLDVARQDMAQLRSELDATKANLRSVGVRWRWEE